MTFDGKKLDAKQKEELRAEIARVQEIYNHITREHLFDDSMQRVVLTLPKPVIHLAQFLSILEERPMPGSLNLWQYVSGIGADDPTPSRNAKRIMRAWLEQEITTRVHVALLQMCAELKEED